MVRETPRIGSTRRGAGGTSPRPAGPRDGPGPKVASAFGFCARFFRGGRTGRREGAMRLWHVTFGVILLALVLTLIREDVGRVAVIVFFTGLGEVAFGTAGVLALFQ